MKFIHLQQFLMEAIDGLRLISRVLSPAASCMHRFLSQSDSKLPSNSVNRQLTGHSRICALSLWLSGLIRFLSHSTCWAYLAGDLQRSGIKSGSRHELSVGWTNDRYGMRLISRTGTEGPPVSSLNCDRCRLRSYDITAR